MVYIIQHSCSTGRDVRWPRRWTDISQERQEKEKRETEDEKRRKQTVQTSRRSNVTTSSFRTISLKRLLNLRTAWPLEWRFYLPSTNPSPPVHPPSLPTPSTMQGLVSIHQKTEVPNSVLTFCLQ